MNLNWPRVSLLHFLNIIPVLLIEWCVFCGERLKRGLSSRDNVQSLGGGEIEMYAANADNFSKRAMGNEGGMRETDKFIMRNTEPYVPRMTISDCQGL